MKKSLLLLFVFALKSIIAQNGFTTYSGVMPSGGSPGGEKALLIDNAGNKWIACVGSSSTSAAGLSFYSTISGTWTFYNMANTPTLPSNYIKCLAKDNTGNIWIGTNLGLVKYNGTAFTAYTTANGLPSNTINAIESFNNMLYIATPAGLSRFDGISFTNYNPTNSLFPFNSVSALKIENANTIWAGSSNNLVKFNINSSYTSTFYSIASMISTLYSINSIYIDGTGNKWLGTSAEVVMYDNINFNYFASMYPNFMGSQSTGGVVEFTKGPNNGVMFASGYYVYPGINNCLIELLPGGNYNAFYAPAGLKIGSYLANDGANTIFITIGTTPVTGISSPQMFSFNKTSYIGFGLGPGGGVNANNFKFLDINRVKAGIMNRGDMWWDIGHTGNARYEVPSGSVPNGGVHSAFAASLWMGGLDAAGQLHTSAQTYRQKGSDFWPGPLDTISAGTDTAHVAQYDKIWKVSYNDINTFIIQFNAGNVPTTYTPTPDILSWPAKGTGNNTRNMAPFVDVNANGIYDPMVGGDYPEIKGDETLYYIFNDNFTSHSETNGLPFGVEVHAMAYAYECSSVLAGRNELAYTTFYDYKIYNRSNTNYNNVYVGFWNDADLGCYLDDYIGSDPQSNLGFIYNATNADKVACNGTNAYGNYPPAAGSVVLKGPLAPLNDGIDNNHDGTTDEPGEQCLLSKFTYYNNNIGSFLPQTTNPQSKYHYYNYLRGQWKDSTSFTCGGNAYGGTTPTDFVYSQNNYAGNPCGTWTEYTAGNLAGDRRYIVSSGPFNLSAKQMTEVEYAYVWSVDSSATVNQNLAAVTKLISDAGKVKTFYNGTIPNCLLSINIGINEEKAVSNKYTLYPNPGHYAVNVRSEQLIKTIEVIDVTGRAVMSIDHVNQLGTEFNVENLSNGVYFVKVSGRNWTSTSKLVKN